MSHPISSELPDNMIEIARRECLHFDVILFDQSDAGRRAAKLHILHMYLNGNYSFIMGQIF
jgi:hypothetical protein